jgi:hypothetical protein
MALTATDIAALDRAIASGELSVHFSDGRSVTYRSIGDLLKAKAEAQKEVNAAAGTVLRRTVVRTVKGW